MLMRDEEGRKKEASKAIQTTKKSNTAIPKAVTLPKINELPRVGFEPTTLHTLYRTQCTVCVYIFNTVPGLLCRRCLETGRRH